MRLSALKCKMSLDLSRNSKKLNLPTVGIIITSVDQDQIRVPGAACSKLPRVVNMGRIRKRFKTDGGITWTKIRVLNP